MPSLFWYWFSWQTYPSLYSTSQTRPEPQLSSLKLLKARGWFTLNSPQGESSGRKQTRYKKPLEICHLSWHTYFFHEYVMVTTCLTVPNNKANLKRWRERHDTIYHLLLRVFPLFRLTIWGWGQSCRTSSWTWSCNCRKTPHPSGCRSSDRL